MTRIFSIYRASGRHTQCRLWLDAAVIEGAAADRTGDAVFGMGGERGDVGQRCNPARGDDRDSDLTGKPGGADDVRAGECAVAGDVGVDDRGNSGVGEPPSQIDRAHLLVSAQPSTATRPPRASMPTTMRPGQSAAARRTSAGSRNAAVPRTTRSIPRSSHRSIAARSRMPPPSWTLRSTARQIARTASPLTERPAKSAIETERRQPAAKADFRELAGLSRRVVVDTVALAISPRTRRTQAPAFKSIAG